MKEHTIMIQINIDRIFWLAPKPGEAIHVEPITDCLMTVVLIIAAKLQTTPALKSTIFWNITPRSPLSVNRRFGGTYRLNLQGRKNKFNKKPAWQPMVLATCSHAGFLLNLFSRPWRWRRYLPPKRRLTLNGLQDVVSQKMALFIIIAVRTSNPITPALSLSML
jgi:hypothetical protein